MTSIHLLLAFALPYRGALALATTLMLCESGVGLALPWLGGRFAEAFLEKNAIGAATLPGPLWAMLGLIALQGLLRFANAYVIGGIVTRIGGDLKTSIYDHLQSLPLSFFQQRRQGDTLSLLTGDAHVVSAYIGGTAIALAPLLFTAGGAFTLMFRTYPSLAVLAVMLMLLFYALGKIVGRRMRPLARQLQEEHAKALAIAEENLGMLLVIKTFTRETLESERYRRQIERIVDLSAKERRLYAALGPGAQFIAVAAVVLALWLTHGDLVGDSSSVADLVSFLLYGQLMARPAAGLADIYGQTQQMRGALARLLEAFNEEPEPPWSAGDPLPCKLGGDIEFREVSFAYPDRPWTLRRLNLRIAAGETVAITGPNGAGKSTLTHLLVRLLEPTEGAIFVDRTDISTVSLRSLRNQIGIVSQNIFLRNASVRDNIAYGQTDPTLPEIEAAARSAGAHDFILGLPEGYDTFIGDRGVRLSGGQQQRLALARTLLKEPSVIVFDEATAMFDPEGEREFIAECHDLLTQRTVILITHRPASLALADRILRLEEGQLVVVWPDRQASGRGWTSHAEARTK